MQASQHYLIDKRWFGAKRGIKNMTNSISALYVLSSFAAVADSHQKVVTTCEAVKRTSESHFIDIRGFGAFDVADNFVMFDKTCSPVSENRPESVEIVLALPRRTNGISELPTIRQAQFEHHRSIFQLVVNGVIS